ncbi:DapH/DapD/GlmU-related protein [Phytopseudomonas dryadis]|uniref:UDP-3-O-(3-hydroxymyristoyl)glucosamine N-acyltransferase n=1 Tax=Phytopseudomonas dryadis TaxID=2487520 RepID=A0ABY1Z966_9GAMM|nr:MULTISPECIES: DapH/DapD/GlmU-related protein [Pseudomonas]TBV07936.1 UDP-3-O-(3-hydroxymyristoyl)glucosamine N-acyltransferase [Pseudomonas dryadis]TBV19331.1 UDP-3-O-(3-hydroxymyristoyl)glucosamine N-acyltransferase [Pseudomonas sp. FRB 230]
MASKWVVGASAYLEQAFQAWKQARPQQSLERIEILQYADYSFDLAVIDSLNPADGDMFVAFDERFGNFKRMELMQAAMARGFKLEAFIHPSAVVGAGVSIGMNVFVGPLAVIGHGTRIDDNSVIHAGVHIGAGGKIMSSCWIENGVQLGAAVELGAHCTIRMGASIRAGVKVGHGCELAWPRLYERDVPNRTVFDCRYDEPIHTYGA